MRRPSTKVLEAMSKGNRFIIKNSHLMEVVRGPYLIKSGCKLSRIKRTKKVKSDPSIAVLETVKAMRQSEYRFIVSNARIRFQSSDKARVSNWWCNIGSFEEGPANLAN